MLTTDQKGSVAETAITFAAIKLGIGVYKPVVEGGRYDLIFEVAAQLFRVQCKWAPLQRETLVVRCYSTRRARAGLVRRKYTANEVDLIVAYSPELDRCYAVPSVRFAGHNELRLRVEPSRNNQRLGINWADDFVFEALHWLPQGAIAQLGERVHGMHEVAGSSPAGSMNDEAAQEGRLRLL